jgi:hypothetical protein
MFQLQHGIEFHLQHSSIQQPRPFLNKIGFFCIIW